MFEQEKKQDTTNFWVSYADLMAGLLFVFILLIGAIVVKSVVLKSNLDSTKSELTKKKQDLTSTKSALTLKNDEIQRLKGILLDKKAEISNLSKKLILLQIDMRKLDKKLGDRDKEIKRYKNDIIVLSNQLVDANNSMKLKDEQMVALLSKLHEKENRYERLVADLKDTKSRIKNLTGIKIKVISILKDALGNRIKMDENGALRLSSNILFDKGKTVLKNEAKKELEEVFVRYIETLVLNPKIQPHLDKIIIEGHTDSDGGYLYNLNLSQARAYSVMNYLLSLDFAKKHDIKKYILASGRSFLDPVKNRFGREDKEASRRIEIKFLLKNNQAMHEIEKILEDE